MIGHRVIGFVDDENVGDLHDAGFEHLHRIAAARLQRDQRRLREFRNFNFALPDADRFDQHDVEAERIHQQQRVGGRARDAAEMAAASHRANKDVGVDEMFGQTNAIAEQRAVRKRRTRIDGDNADAAAERTRFAHDGRRQRRLADPGRPGESDRHRAPRPRIQTADQFGAAAAFGPRNRARQTTRFLCVEIVQEVRRGRVR